MLISHQVKVLKILLLVLPLSCFAQEGIPYLDFRLNNAGSAVEVEWVVAAGNFCQDVEIWRGTDSSGLEQVYVYPGICGDDDSAKAYQYLDQPPTPGIRYYYRIVIITDRTEIKSFLLLPESGVQLFPVPAQDFLRIVRNEDAEYEEYALLDLSGRLLMRRMSPAVTEEIRTHELRAGEYILRIKSQGRYDHQRFTVR